MRFDYALYGLAIVLFALTAITFMLVADSDGKLLYSASTGIVGILSLVGGYFLRPKNLANATRQTVNPQAPTRQEFVSETPQQTGGPIVEAAPTQIQVVETPKIEIVAVQTPVVVDAPSTVEVEPVAVAASVAPAEGASQETSTKIESAFSQIRGISEKRAEQLKSVGINTLQDLANASATELAEKLSVSPKIVKMWVGSAKKLSK
jgi:predicted flap endonuclease-1-like 5' DNA nuclease